MEKLKKDKRGAYGILVFFIILFSIVILGFIGVMATGIIDYTSDTITPIMNDLGVVGSANVSEASGYTFNKLNSVVQALPWLVGFSYVAMLIFSVVFVVVYPESKSPVFMGFYVILTILLVFFCIIMSNMYQDIYTGTDEIATRLQENVLMSYMILYSPAIMTAIAFITGIYLFANPQTGSGGYGGI